MNILKCKQIHHKVFPGWFTHYSRIYIFLENHFITSRGVEKTKPAPMQSDDQFSVEAGYRSRRKHRLSRRRDALYITPRRIYERERGQAQHAQFRLWKGWFTAWWRNFIKGWKFSVIKLHWLGWWGGFVRGFPSEYWRTPWTFIRFSDEMCFVWLNPLGNEFTVNWICRW